MDYIDPREVVPTVKVVSGDGFIVINESDFNPEVHKRWSPPTTGAGGDAANDGGAGGDAASAGGKKPDKK